MAKLSNLIHQVETTGNTIRIINLKAEVAPVVITFKRKSQVHDFLDVIFNRD